MEFRFYVNSPKGYRDEEVVINVPANGVASEHHRDFEKDVVAFLKQWYDVRIVLTEDEEQERLEDARQREQKQDQDEN